MNYKNILFLALFGLFTSFSTQAMFQLPDNPSFWGRVCAACKSHFNFKWFGSTGNQISPVNSEIFINDLEVAINNSQHNTLPLTTQSRESQELVSTESAQIRPFKPYFDLLKQVKSTSEFQPKNTNFFASVVFEKFKTPSRTNLIIKQARDSGSRSRSKYFNTFAHALLSQGSSKVLSQEIDGQKNSSELSKLMQQVREQKPFGIHNKGNTCYLNSMLQIFTVLQKVQGIFIPYKEDFESSNIPGVKRFQKYLSLTSPSNLTSSKLDPSSSLMDSLANASFVEPGRQGDTMESTYWILNNLCDAAPGLKNKFAVNTQTTTYCNSDICKNKSFKVEDNNQYVLCVPVKSSLQEGISALCKATAADSDAICPSCNTKGKVYQKSELKGVSEVLFITLMRNENGSGAKNTTPVKYPLSLALDNKTYTPIAIAMQAGSANGGHWVASDLENKKLFNDSVVSDITDKEIKETAATGRVAFRGYSHFDIAGLLYVQTKK